MGNEYEAFAVVESSGSTSDSILCRGDSWQWRASIASTFFLRPLLKQEAAVVLRFCAFDIKSNPTRCLVELLKNTLELFGRKQINSGTPASGHEEEDTPQHDIEL